MLQNKEIIKNGVPQTAKISKLERIFSKSPSQLGFAGEHLLWGAARGVLFFSSAAFTSRSAAATNIITEMVQSVSIPFSKNHQAVVNSSMVNLSLKL